jgi:hypothetical protein
MASTYSPNLALELIGTGDQAGTWGNTTNTNLGTLLEQAISGYVTQAVSTGTDTTITIPNGADGVARNMFIELTGTGGASTNLIVPANKKLYFVYNNASGAVTVKVAGQTGVSVPAGSKFILVSNGTDIVEATSYSTGVGSSLNLTTLTATSANITTLSGTSVSYTSGSFTSANITTLTGTNFSATSLTLTNALGVAEGGTGVDSTPTNGQILIGNGTGYTLATLTAGSGITITNGTGTISLAAGGLPAVSIQNTTTISAVAGNHYILTAASLTTLTLPASPTISDTIYVTVANGLVTNVVANNGKPIQGISESLVLNAQYASVQLRFTDNTEGWVLA